MVISKFLKDFLTLLTSHLRVQWLINEHYLRYDNLSAHSLSLKFLADVPMRGSDVEVLLPPIPAPVNDSGVSYIHHLDHLDSYMLEKSENSQWVLCRKCIIN